MSSTLFSFSFLQLAGTLFITSILYVLYKIVLRPLYRMNFYKQQGAHMMYFPLIGSFGKAILDFRKHGDFKYYFKVAAREHPAKITCTNLGSDAYFLVHDPAMIKEFCLNIDNYVKDPVFLEAYAGMFGKGLITSEGATWKKQRKILSNMFNFEFIKSMFPVIKDTVHQHLYNIRKTSLTNVVLLDEFQNITGQVVGKTFFGDQLNEHSLNGKPLTIVLDSLIGQVGRLSFAPEKYLLGIKFIQKGILPKHKKLMQEIKMFREICLKIINDRRNSHAGEKRQNKTKDMLDYLLEYEGEEGKIQDDEIIDQFISFFIAGMDTTGHAVTVSEYYLQTRPELRKRMLEEVTKHYNRDCTVDDLNKLEFTMAFLKEILRVASPAPGLIPRRVVKDHTLQGFKIRKGDVCGLEYFYNQFNQEYFEDPDTFNPDRWLTKDKNLDSYAFTPFSMGPRNCIGQHLALIESRVILAEYLTMYDSKMKEGYKLRMNLRFLYEPEDPILVDLTPKYE